VKHLLETRRISAAIAAAATIVLTAGVPFALEADHEGDHAHIEHAHGGHDHFLIVDDGRVTAPTAAPLAPPVYMAVALGPDVTERAIMLPEDAFPHSGRDPPLPLLPRGPPPTLF
jgi:hypothetical protein